MSVDPPAANGTTMRIGFAGYDSAAIEAPAHVRQEAATLSAIRLKTMVDSFEES